MAEWADGLRDASFRGVSFHVASHDLDGGRRAVSYEYPLKDEPYTDDMGRKMRNMSIDAYVLGDDYFSQRDALVSACEQAGPGELVHPYLGAMLVQCTGYRLREQQSEGRIATFSMQFVEAGEFAFPAASIDPDISIDADIDLTNAAQVDDFARIFTVDGLPQFTVDSVVRTFSAWTDQLIKTLGSDPLEAGSIAKDINTFSSSLRSLILTPRLLAQNVISIYASVRDAYKQPEQGYRALRQFFSFKDSEPPIPQTTTTRMQQAKNQAAVVSLITTGSVIASASTARPQIKDGTIRTYEDAISLRDQIADPLDDVSEVTENDDLYREVSGLRIDVVKYVPGDEFSLPRLTAFTPNATTAALVISYELYESVDNEFDIIDRNNIVHPGMTPGGQLLQVLTDE